MGKSLITLSVIFGITILLNVFSQDKIALAQNISEIQDLPKFIKDFYSGINYTSDPNLTSDELDAQWSMAKNVFEATIAANTEAAKLKSEEFQTQQQSFSTIIVGSIVAIAILIVLPLLYSLFLTYRQGRAQISMGISVRPVVQQLYRLLVAVGVLFTVILIIVYLNTVIWFNLNFPGEILNSLLETQKNFLTIIGTAFASLVAFYFGSRGTQGSNEKTIAVKKHESNQTALECIDVSPLGGSIGIEADSKVTAKFNLPLRGSTINENTFSIKDKNDNYVQGKVSLTDNNMTLVFSPIPSFNQDTRYTVIVKKEILARSGVSMDKDVEWYFTTSK